MSSELAQVDLEGKSARELHNSGGKCYAMHDYPAAVQYLSRASELGVKEYGDPLHDDMGEIYLLYGKSLLELTREEGDPLGENVPKDVPVGEEEAEEEEDEEEEEEEEEEEADGDGPDEDQVDDSEEGAAKNEDDGEVKERGDANEDMEDENAKNEEEEGKKTNVEGMASGVEFNGEKGDGGGTETKEGESDDLGTSDKEEEPSDLQVAWEILELAKMIFAKRGEPGKPYLADTLITLGEISMESENVESAIEDIKEAVEILKTLHNQNSRVLAEAYYKLGMATAMDNKIDEAVEHYNKSKEILENRIKSLEPSERALHKREVEDMRKLLPEIEEKVADLRSFHEEQLKKATEDPRPVLPGSPEKKASDISHLVKRKRKLEDEGSASSSSPLPKKPALD